MALTIQPALGKMSKFSRKLILFIEPSAEPFSTPSKIGHLFMNRFAIDEDAGHEILKIYQFEEGFLNNDSVKSYEGLDLMNFQILVHDSWTYAN